MFDTSRFFRDHKIAFRVSSVDSSELKISCPQCDGWEKLWIRADSGVAYCHKCQWRPDLEQFLKGLGYYGKDLLNILSQYRALPKGDIESYILDQLEGLGSVQGRSNGRSHRTQKDCELPDGFRPLSDPCIKQVWDYAHARGITEDNAKKWKLGGCHGGRYHGYLILPVYEHGKLMFWQARDALSRSNLLRYKTPVGHSGNITLWNIDVACKHSEVVICEGVFSAMRA